MKFLKKSVDVQVSFAHAAGEICTLEGVVHYETGDALLTGVAGEQWPVERSRFEQTYAPVPPLEMGQRGIYRKKYLPVAAQQLVSDRRIELQGGRGVLDGSAGDWLITDPEGRQWVVQQDIFEHSYIALDDLDRTEQMDNAGGSIAMEANEIPPIDIYVGICKELADKHTQLEEALKKCLPCTTLSLVQEHDYADQPLWFVFAAKVAEGKSSRFPDVEKVVLDTADTTLRQFVDLIRNEAGQWNFLTHTFFRASRFIKGLFGTGHSKADNPDDALPIIAGQLASLECFNAELKAFSLKPKEEKEEFNATVGENFLQRYDGHVGDSIESFRRVGGFADIKASENQELWQRLVLGTTKEIAAVSANKNSFLYCAYALIALLCRSWTLILLGLVAALGLASFSELSEGCNPDHELPFFVFIGCGSEIWKHWFGLASILGYLAALLYAWIRFARAKAERWETRHQDFRLLAESLRVQYVYAVLGESKSIVDDLPTARLADSGWVRLALRSLKYAHPYLPEPRDKIDLKKVSQIFIDHQTEYHETTLIMRRENAIGVLSLASRWGMLVFLLMMCTLAANQILPAILSGDPHGGFLSDMTRHFVLIFQVLGLAFWGGMRKVLDSYGLEQEMQRGELVLDALKRADCKDIDSIIEAARYFLRDQEAWHALHRSRPIEAATGG